MTRSSSAWQAFCAAFCNAGSGIGPAQSSHSRARSPPRRCSSSSSVESRAFACSCQGFPGSVRITSSATRCGWDSIAPCATISPSWREVERSYDQGVSRESLVFGIAGTFFGLLIGWMLGSQQQAAPIAASAAAAASPSSQTSAAPSPPPVDVQRAANLERTEEVWIGSHRASLAGKV